LIEGRQSLHRGSLGLGVDVCLHDLRELLQLTAHGRNTGTSTEAGQFQHDGDPGPAGPCGRVRARGHTNRHCTYERKKRRNGSHRLRDPLSNYQPKLYQVPRGAGGVRVTPNSLRKGCVPTETNILKVLCR
jgi:hypothetical protein